MPFDPYSAIAGAIAGRAINKTLDEATEQATDTAQEIGALPPDPPSLEQIAYNIFALLQTQYSILKKPAIDQARVVDPNGFDLTSCRKFSFVLAPRSGAADGTWSAVVRVHQVGDIPITLKPGWNRADYPPGSRLMVRSGDPSFNVVWRQADESPV